MTRAEWPFVREDQCSGRTRTCINCDSPLGRKHKGLCYAAAVARQEELRREQ
jgi:hypothetical protein